MKQEEIKNKYEALIDRIEAEKIYDGRGTFDLYECEECGARKITTYKDKGVTPFMIRCSCCDGFMRHTRTFNSIPKFINVEDWIRPALEQAYNMTDYQLEHLFKGGLFLKSELIGLLNHKYE
jgi:hypothetical protein